MAASRALRRLLRIRDLEEEQCRLALETALGELNALENAMRATVERERQGRRLVEASARSGELADRLAGIEESHAADRLFAILGARIAAKEDEVAMLRQQFFAKRVERRQAETLIEEAEVEEALDAERRGQQDIDDWYGAREYRDQGGMEAARSAKEELRSSRLGAAPNSAEPESWVAEET